LSGDRLVVGRFGLRKCPRRFCLLRMRAAFEERGDRAKFTVSGLVPHPRPLQFASAPPALDWLLSSTRTKSVLADLFGLIVTPSCPSATGWPRLATTETIADGGETAPFHLYFTVIKLIIRARSPFCLPLGTLHLASYLQILPPVKTIPRFYPRLRQTRGRV